MCRDALFTFKNKVTMLVIKYNNFKFRIIQGTLRFPTIQINHKLPHLLFYHFHTKYQVARDTVILLPTMTYIFTISQGNEEGEPINNIHIEYNIINRTHYIHRN